MGEHDQKLMAVLPYLLEVERQCQLALALADRMGACKEAFWPLADPLSVIGDFFDHAQRFLSSAAVVVKILYAKDDKGGAQRAQGLRVLLGLPDDSPLASWKIRNGFEHFDERIDAWVKEHAGATSYGPFGISRTGEPQSHRVLRHYDSASDVLHVWGEEARLHPIAEAIQDVSARVGDYLRERRQ